MTTAWTFDKTRCHKTYGSSPPLPPVLELGYYRTLTANSAHNPSLVRFKCLIFCVALVVTRASFF